MTRARIASQQGFTLVEVTITMLILLVGLGGAVTLINGANATTVETKQREAANSLQRELIENARAVPYAQLTTNGLRAGLQAVSGLADSTPSTGEWTIERRNTVYSVTTDVCSVDDPRDSLGDHGSGTFCAGQSDGSADTGPDDLKRIFVEIEWSGRGGTTSRSQQGGIVTNPSNNAGPQIVAFTRAPSHEVITTDVPVVTFTATTGVPAAAVRYLVDGTVSNTATPSGTSSQYVWTINSGETYVVDGTYVISATALDSAGFTGSTRALTVKLNRSAPLAPNGLVGGWNATRQAVDLGWSQNDESDVVGYRVYRTIEGGSPERVCETAPTVTTCLDSSHPEPFASYYDYYVVATDETTAGTTREGTSSDVLHVVPSDTRPNPPPTLTASLVEGNHQLIWGTPPAPAEPYEGDGLLFFRIYRDGTAVADRFDHTGLGSDRAYTDTDVGGQSRQYWVTTVDENYSESEPVGPVALP